MKSFPSLAEIPDEFKDAKKNPWIQYLKQWYFSGLPNTLETLDGSDVMESKQEIISLWRGVLTTENVSKDHLVAGLSFLLSKKFKFPG